MSKVYICDNWPDIEIKTKYYLIRYKNIYLDRFYINDFETFKKNQKKYILNIWQLLNNKYLKEDLKIIETINNFREKNNLRKLKRKYGLPDFIINEISEVILFKSQHLFKLPNNKYLLKYKFGKFNDYFKNNDEELIK